VPDIQILLRAGVLMVTLLKSFSHRGATKFGYSKLGCRPIGDRSGRVMQEHLILGIDDRDAEAQRDLWLSQNPAIKVIKIHGVKREPPNLLTRTGGKCVPRVSILVEYEASGAHSQRQPIPRRG
jgi:hypothetical protein